MTKTKNRANVKVIKAAKPAPISKAATDRTRSGQVESTTFGAQLITPPYPQRELRKLTEMSTILGQCITAYKRNIVGFGTHYQYNFDDSVTEETDEMRREWDELRAFIRHFHFDKSFEDIFAQVIEHREECGNAYLEVLRDGKGLPAEGVNIEPEYIRCTPLGKPHPVIYNMDGIKVVRQVRFRKYCQEIGSQMVWFKEFGDPRRMDYRTGNYFGEDEETTEDQEATELLHFKIGDGAYGVPRWIGQLVHMYGARKAEELNYRYFQQGRHTPMAILLSNAELAPESEEALTEYASAVEGVENSHKFLIIESSATMDADDLLHDKAPKPSVSLEPLAEILQQDALFLEYDDKSRMKVQSAFGLPDIYVGRSKDYNKATADTARTITEEQVFEPERNSLEWIINNKLLPEHEFKFVEMIFKKAEISDTEEFARLMNIYIRGHAVTPNDLREHAGRALSKEMEPFDDPLASEPIGLRRRRAGEYDYGDDYDIDDYDYSHIAKSDNPNKSAMLNLLKDVRDALEEVVASEKSK